MKEKALLAKYRIEGEPIANKGFAALGLTADWYEIPINGNRCKVSISHEFGDTHLCTSVILPSGRGRLPTYEECLKIKDFFFEENEMLVFGLSKNLLMNITVTNPFAMHIYAYDGKMPPVQKIMEIDDYKVDGDYKIKKDNRWGWNFVKISGDKYPDMEEICSLKMKYSPNRDVAVFLIKGAVIMFSNPKEGIIYHRLIMK